MADKFHQIRLPESKSTLKEREDAFEKFLKENITDNSVFIDDSPDSFIDWLKSTDFFTCPSSCLFHGNYQSGLFIHTMGVAKRALIIAKEAIKNVTPEQLQSVFISAICHDLCKIGTYELGSKNFKKDDGTWVKIPTLKKAHPLNLGHGEGSIFLAQKFFDLSIEEAQAVRWHMSAFEHGTSSWETGASFGQAMNTNKLLKVLILADQWQSWMNEKAVDWDKHFCEEV